MPMIWAWERPKVVDEEGEVDEVEEEEEAVGVEEPPKMSSRMEAIEPCRICYS